MKKLLTLLLVCSIFAGSIYAGGFQLNEQGARAMAMAGAFTGLANDPSAIYFNPAGITQLSGTNFSLGTTMILPLAKFNLPQPNNSQTDMDSQVFTLINFYLTHAFSEKLSVGIGINNQFGLGTRWNPNWIGRKLAVETSVKAFTLTPVLAYKLFKNFSVSAGPTISMAKVKITQKSSNPNPTQPEPLITLESVYATAVGFTAGILYKLNDMWQFGLSYRSESKYSLTGTVASDPSTFVHPLLHIGLPFPNGTISAPLTTPQSATLGIAWMPDKDWTATFDFQFVGWSSYDNLTVTFDNYDLDLNPANGTQNVETIPRNYKDTYIARLGFEYKASENFAVRFGLLYDHNPVPDEYVEPTLPDADRLGFNIGFGGKLTEHLGVDFSYMYLSFNDRIVQYSKFGFNGTYSNSAHLFGFNLNYSL